MLSYFNYHAKIRNLIKSGDCIGASLVQRHNQISPALVFYFKSHKPMPVRDYRFEEYSSLIKQYGLTLHNEHNLPFP